MSAWHQSQNFSPEYVDFLDSDDVRDLAKLACTKATPPVVECETNKAKTIICQYTVSRECIHGDSCKFSHHPSRGLIDRGSSQSVKDKWRTDYHWQLWALAYAGANSTEFRYASDAPHNHLRELVIQMHGVANRLIQKQRADADNLERQRIAKAKEAHEQKVLDDFQEKTKLKEVIKKEIGDKLAELDSTLTDTLQNLRDRQCIDDLSFKRLINLTSKDVDPQLGAVYTESVNLISLLLSFLLETSKLAKLRSQKNVEKKSQAKHEKCIFNAQKGSADAKKALEKWSKKKNASAVLERVCSLITTTSLSSGDISNSNSNSKLSAHQVTPVEPTLAPVASPVPMAVPSTATLPVLECAGEKADLQPIDPRARLLRRTLGLPTTTTALHSAPPPLLPPPPPLRAPPALLAPSGLARDPPPLVVNAPPVVREPPPLIPRTQVGFSSPVAYPQHQAQYTSVVGDALPAFGGFHSSSAAIDTTYQMPSLPTPSPPPIASIGVVGAAPAPTTSLLTVEEWLAKGAVASSSIDLLATALRELGFTDTEMIYSGTWEELCGDLDDLKDPKLSPVHKRQIKKAFDIGLQQGNDGASPVLATTPLAPSPLSLSSTAPLSGTPSTFSTSLASNLPGVKQPQDFGGGSAAVPPALSPGAHTSPRMNELARFHQERLCLDQLLVHVAVPVFLRYFEATWDEDMSNDPQTVCKGCNKNHVFNEIKPGCVLCVALLNKHSLMITFAQNTPEQARGAEVLRFDVGMLCSAFDYLHGGWVRRNSMLDKVVSDARNVQAHLVSGDPTELSQAADELVNLVHFLMEDLHCSAEEMCEVQETIRQCRTAKTYLQLEQFHFEDLSHRVSEMQFRRFDLYNLSAMVSARFERTLQIAGALSQKAVSKILFLPPLCGSSKELNAYREQYGFLDAIAWKTVFDFSGVEGGFLPKCAGNTNIDYFFAAKPMSESRKLHMSQEFASIVSNDAVEKACFFATFPAPPVQGFATVHDEYLRKLTVLLEFRSLPCCKFFVLSETDTNEPSEETASGTTIEAVLSKLNSPLGPDVSPPVAKLSPLEQTRRCSLKLLEAELSKANGGKTLLIPSGVLGTHRYPLSSKLWDEFLTHAEGEILDFGCGSYPSDRKTGKDNADIKKKANLHAFLDGVPAAWPLFADGSLNRRGQFDAIRNALDDPNKQSVLLRHASQSGGTTLARHVLYSLHERFICIAVSSFKSTADIEQAVEVLKRIHREVGNEIIVLIDLASEEFSEAFRNDVRQHMRKIGTFCRYIECSTHAQPSSTQKVFSSDGDTLQIDLQPMSAAEATELMDRYPDWFPNRHSELSHCLAQCLGLENFSLPSEYLSSGLFESGLVWATIKVKADTCGWEMKLVKFAIENPEDLIQGGFWPLEVYELSSQDTSFYGINEKYKLTKLPLIHCGLLAANNKYAARARKAVQAIVEYLYASNPCEFKFLKFLVFASLFAPSVRFSTAFYKLFDPEDRPLSQSFMEMVRCETMGFSGSSTVVSIPIPKMAMIIAEHEHMFKSTNERHVKSGASKRSTGKEVEDAPLQARALPVVGDYAKGVLIPLIKQCAENNRFVKLRQHLLYTLNYAFCRFNVWHWVLRNQRNQHEKSYSFIVEFLKKSNSVEFAADVFEQVALAAIPLVNAQTKHNVGLLTHACRLLEEYALNKQLSEQARVEWLGKATSVLARITSNFSKDPVVLLRRASIAKKEMLGLIKIHSKMPASLPLSALRDLFESSLYLFQAATEQSEHSWSHPLVGMVQLTISMISALQAKFRCEGSIEGCRVELDRCNETGAKRLLHFVTLDEVKKMYNLLTGSRLASKYIVTDTDLERQQAYLTTCVNDLAAVCGQTTDLQKAQVMLHTCTNNGPYIVRDMELENLCWCLAVIGKDMHKMLAEPEVPPAAQNDAQALAADATNWAVKAEMENIVELSTAIAARVYSLNAAAGPCFWEGFTMPQVSRHHCNDLWVTKSTEALRPRTWTREHPDLSVLYHPDAALVRWLAYPASSAHGLCRHVANVMMCIYYKLFALAAAPAGPADTLDTALSKLLASSARYGNVYTTRYFIAEQCAIEGMPLTAFIAVECNPELFRARNDRSKHGQYVRAFRTQETVRLFRGEVMPPPSQRNADANPEAAAEEGGEGEGTTGVHGLSLHPRMVSCAELGLSIRFHNGSNLDGSPEFAEGQLVQYAVGIKDNGLYAHGLSRVFE